MTEPAWRTPTVVMLCEAMRGEQAYHAAPILADALEDADFAEAYALGRLRDPDLPRWEAERLVAVLYSEETRAAVEWLTSLAAGAGTHTPNYARTDVWDYDTQSYVRLEDPIVLPVSYEMVVAGAHRFLDTDGEELFVQLGDDWLRDETDQRSDRHLSEFWTKFGIATGRWAPVGSRTPFSCSC